MEENPKHKVTLTNVEGNPSLKFGEFEVSENGSLFVGCGNLPIEEVGDDGGTDGEQ